MIVFINDISETNNLMAFNNNVVRFTSDTEDKIILKAEITLDAQVITIYPSPDNIFYFNFKEYVMPKTNTNGFVDNINPELDASDINTFSYQGTGWFRDDVLFKIIFTDTTSETDNRNLFFLNSVEQLQNYKRNETQQTGEVIFLTPLTPLTNNKYYVKYWEGYPFDISILRRENTVDFKLLNTTNLLDYVFNEKDTITRLFFCDGSTDESINDLLPIALGENVIKISSNGGSELPIIYADIFLTVDKQDVCEGVYIKWVNNYGGYSYWKFDNFYQQSTNTKSIGELNRDFENLENTFSATTEIGKTANDRLIVNTDLLTDAERVLLQSLFISPKIYLFTGEPFARASVNDWVEVKLITSNNVVRNYKQQPATFKFEFELPDYYTQTL